MESMVGKSRISRYRPRLGVAMLSLGVASLALGAFSGGASAWEGSCYDYAPTPGAWSELRVAMPDTDIAQLSGQGQQFSDGVLAVVLSGATKADDTAPLAVDNVGSLDFSATPGVAAVYVRAGGAADKVYLYDQPTTAGAALHAADATTPVEWVTFCYVPATTEATTSTTSTTTSTTTTTLAPSTTLAPTTTAAPQVVVQVTTTAPTEVLGEQLQRAPLPELAFTGRNSTRFLVLGVVLVLAGADVTLADRLVPRRRPH